MATIAIDIGGTKTSAALIEDDDDAFIEYATWPSPPSAEGAIEQIVIACAPWTDSAIRVGVSFGGPFDFPTQTCVRSMHVPGWAGMDISARLQHALGIWVITDNDANVAALGEYACAPREHRDPMLYVTVSTGVGSAMIINDALVRGAHSLAGEVGHLPIGHDDVCNCGQHGCLERAVSGYWIEYDHGVAAHDYLQSPEHHERWIADLTRGLWSATVLLDPALIVMGGGMSAQGERLIMPLRAAFAHLGEVSNRTPPGVTLGDASGRTVLLGAAMMAKGAVHESR